MKAHLPSGCHHAGILRRRSVAGFELSEIAYCADLKLPAHRHERAGFCLVLSGIYNEDYGSSLLPCRPQTVTFSPAQERHSNHFGRAGRSVRGCFERMLCAQPCGLASRDEMLS